MTTNIQICNVALSVYCGQKPITSLEENTPQAEACALHFANTRQALFERAWWNFAKARQMLALESNDRPEWAYRYARPTQALSIHWVNEAEIARVMLATCRSPDALRETAGQSIYSDVKNATCEFTRLITDAALYPQYFSDALSAALAVRIVPDITQDARRMEMAERAAQIKLDEAIVLDMKNEPPLKHPTPEFLQARGVY